MLTCSPTRFPHFYKILNMATTGATTPPMVNGHDTDYITNKPSLSHMTTNISLTPEQFERLYLAPKVPHAADNAAKFANAVPLGFLG